jgi:hypothetical protein
LEAFELDRQEQGEVRWSEIAVDAERQHPAQPVHQSLAAAEEIVRDMAPVELHD